MIREINKQQKEEILYKRLPLNRKAVALWLIDNTSLTFEQIADFCGFHELEIQGMADGEVASGIVASNPIYSGQLTKESIEECEKNPNKKLNLREQILDTIELPKKKKGTYVPIAKRQDKPSAILFLLKYHPNLNDKQIKKLIGTTNSMIDSIREKTHWNIKEMVPKDPVLLGLCSQTIFNEVVNVGAEKK
jgi:hypothetical protein